ncbi:MAG: hypothetical protein ABSD62_09655 [Candidatus Limnocylindrales bacterium]|jgi:hypothetical protein
MRSCLIQILIMVAIVFCLLWFGLPLGVSALATAALNAGGFTGSDTKVEVAANPPFMLLTGHADTVRIRSSEAGMGDLHAAGVDVTLGDVELLSRNIETVTGTLEGVRVAAPNGDPVTIDQVSLQGSATATTATANMSVAQAEALAESQLKVQTGIVAKVALKGPNLVTVTAGGKSQVGRLVTSNGSLLLVPNGDTLPTVTLISPGSGNPFRVTSVTIGLAGVTLIGTIDIQNLLG